MSTSKSKGIQIVTDSTSDIDPNAASELGIHVVPLYVHFGEDSYKDSIDISADEFYEKLVGGTISPKTSQPTPEDFADIYRDLAAKGPVLSMHVSNLLSGTMNSATLARDIVLKEMPEAQITVVDTFLASLGLANAVIETKKFCDDGASLEEAEEFAKSISARTRIIVSVDTLEYLVRGGRIGKARGLVGGLIQIKPILHLVDGEIHPYEQVRTTRKARSRLISIVTEQKDSIVGAAVATTTELDLANEIAGTLKTELGLKEIPIFRIGPVVGTHGGPGTVGVAFVLDA